MGLDIFAASHLRYHGRIPRGKALERLDAELAERGKGIGDVYFTVYANDPAHRVRLTGTKPGLYEYTKASRRYGFRAGSYSGYNRWRALLCDFAHGVEPETVWFERRTYRGRPFVELIDFTDCDGRIGTQVCAKLAADFTSHAARAKKYAATLANPDDWSGDEWLANYRDFARAFRLAAKGGVLKFC